MKALIIDNVSSQIAKRLEENNIEVRTIVMPGAERLREIISDADILVMRVLPAIDRAILDAAEKLKLIAVCSVGTTHIDLAYAKEKEISVINAPGASANAVAELTICKMLELSRRTLAAHHEVVGSRVWEKNHFVGRELKGKTLGILGYGRIGRRVAEIARVFDMRIIAYDPYLSAEQCAESGAEKLEKDELLRQADIISIHLPLTPETDDMISFEAIEIMKKGAIIVNMSRGGVFNEEAAAAGLKSGKLGGVGLDVIREELADISADAVLSSPLFDVEGNYIVSPHIGAYTVEAQESVGALIADGIADFFHLR